MSFMASVGPVASGERAGFPCVHPCSHKERPTTENTKNEHADRTAGGPGSSHQNADKPETHHHEARERQQQKGSNDAGDHQGPPDGGARPSGRHAPEAPRHPK